MQPPMTSFEDINDPIEVMNTALILFVKAFQLTTPTNNNQRTSSNPRSRQIAQPGMNMSQLRQIQNIGGNGGNQVGQYAGETAQNQQRYNAWQNGGIQVSQNVVQNAGVQNGGNQNGLVVVQGIANQNRTGNIVTAKAKGIENGNQARCYNCRGLGHIARNYTARPRRRDHVSTSGTQLDKAFIYDTDGSTEVQLNDNGYDNEIFNMFTQEEKYTDLLEPILEPQLVPQNDNHVTSAAPSMVQSGGIVETSSAPNEETRAHQETVYRNLIGQVAQFNMVNCNMRATNAELKSELARYKIQEQRMEISHERYDKLEKCYQNHDIMFIVQNGFVDVPSDLQTELDRTKEKLEHCTIKKEKEYDVLWNNWYTKCEEFKHDKISYDKAYNDMQQEVERLQAQLRDLKGKSSDTHSASNTLDPLNQKLKTKIVELEFQMVNYEREISHLKTTYNNLFDSITSNRAHAKLHNLIYKNAKLKAWLFNNTSESMNNTSRISVTPQVDKPKLIVVTPYSKKLHASIPSHSVPQPREFNVVKHSNVIALEMFKIDPSQTFRVDLLPNNQSSASIRTNLITNFQRHVTFKENVSSDTVNASSTGLVHTARIRRPELKGNTRNARVPFASKSSEVKKNVIVEDHRRILLLSKNQKTMSSECNNIKPAIRNDKSEIICGTNKKMVSKFNCVSWQVVQICLWCINSGCSKHMTGNIKLLINFVWKFLETVRFGNDHIAAILGYGDFKWGNITITRVYFVKGLGHNLFSVGQFCDADLEVAFRRNTCFIRDLDGVDLLKGNRSINLYTINLYDMASVYPIRLMACATLTKSWLWHQRLSYLNFDTINDLTKNDPVSGLPKFKYAKEHLCPSCEQGKSKKASHPPKLVPNSKQRLHLLHMDLCGPITKDETPEVIKNFLKKIFVRLQAPVIIVRTDNRTEFKNHALKEYFDSVGITHETTVAKTPQQNGVIERRNRTLVEAVRTMALYYLKNDREDIGKLGAKGDIGFFIGYSANYVAYRVYNQRTKKIMETMNVTFDELLAMAFEQNNSKPELQSLTYGQISSILELTYALSTITPQKPSEWDLDILFEPLLNEYLGDQPSEAPRTVLAAPIIQNLQAPSASMSIQDSVLTPTNSSHTPVSSLNVDAQSQQQA
nr:retrovirus-related Pol polyprotein from transposon TNT 1-94 [Tanacetum cinerariifolium]